jgi:hypothetical protein
MKRIFLSFRSLLITAVILAAAANSGIATEPHTLQASPPSDPTNACQNKPHTVRYSIPHDAPVKITRAIKADGILTCVSVDPSSGFCHIELLEARVEKHLSLKDSMGSGRTDTFTFTCGAETKTCAIFQCD